MRFPNATVAACRLAGFVAVICAAALTGCDRDQHYEVLDGPYRVVAEDRPEDMSVCFQTGPKTCVSRVDGSVFKVGFNKDYIIAARHPPSGPGVWVSANRSKTDYFFIVRAIDGPDEGPTAIRGPMSAAEFERERANYALPQFTREFKIDWETPCDAKPCE